MFIIQYLTIWFKSSDTKSLAVFLEKLKTAQN